MYYKMDSYIISLLKSNLIQLGIEQTNARIFLYLQCFVDGMAILGISYDPVIKMDPFYMI